MKKSYLTVMAVLLGVTLILVSCAAPAPTPAPAAKPAPAPAPAPAPKPARDIVNVPVWTTSPPTDPLVNLIMGAEDISRKNHPWLRIQGVGTTGFNYNVLTLDSTQDAWKTTVIALSDNALEMGKLEEGAFKGHKINSSAYKFLFTYSTAATFLLGLSPINSIADLKGKRIGLGLKTQFGIGILPVGGLAAWGVDDKNTNIQFIGTPKAKEALLNHQIDVTIANIKLNPITWAFEPQQDLIELQSSGQKLYYYDWGEKGIAGVGYNTPGIVVKAGLFGQDKAFTAIGGDLFLGVRDVFPEDLAYEFVKLWLDNYQKFSEYTAAGKLLSPEFLAYGLTTANAHPGALRAYKERGIIIPAK